MTKVATEVVKDLTEKVTGNGNGNGNGKEEKPKMLPAPELKKEMSIVEKILKIENLNLVIGKRNKLIETYSQLERFQIGSNDFNCTMRLSDSDGNVFTTSFTPGIKKVIEFLRHAFEESISETEKQINF